MMLTQAPNQKRRYDDYDYSYDMNSNYVYCTDNSNNGTVSNIDYDTVTSKRYKSTDTSTPKEKKDKIGERVAALQKLVSPFGKSDTASVLQEASGYIKFLHDQIQVLSSPYLRNSVANNIDDSEYYNLRNRGLCLMPVGLTQNIAKSNGADLWAPINSKSRPSNQ
ncbi:hypothetical protein LUZ60_004438 [Juncus effusus]|nr:hypothetical protein LUZ60_004438 [Juncus effusus]